MNKLDAALRLASTGLPVFPCYDTPDDKEVDKTPATPHGFYNATADPERISRWWWHDRLIGVPTGATTGFVVLDVDPDGKTWSEENFERLPRTRVHQTRRKGEHWLYAYPSEPLRNSSGAIAAGVDVRADGGYVVWWPACGGEVLDDVPLDRLPPWPEWLTTLARVDKSTNRRGAYAQKIIHSGRLREYAVEALQGAVERVTTATPHAGNTTLNKETFKLGVYLRSGALSDEEVVNAMVTASLIRGGRSDKETIRTITSALNAAYSQEE